MKQNNKLPLPIDKYIPEILAAIQEFPIVMVKASPGSGKTTRLPWAVSSQLNKNVVVLEPRKLAAKLAGSRIAFEENLSLGREVGYHFRFEKVTGSDTQLTFYTEGTFLKLFLNDPELKKTDVVILDEFHERHLDSDLALALILSLQERRPDLRIIIMSATLDSRMTGFLPGSKFIEIEAPLFPVEIKYLPNQPSILNQSLELKVKNALKEVSPQDGDVLIFLPGMREMRKVQEVLEQESFILHGDLSQEEQQRVLGPSSKQKIILSTNIAESSLTIPGVRVVIDAGIQREAHYSSWNGLSQVKDSPATQASSIQRTGRAARTGPGKCFRLYSEQDFNSRSAFSFPEIQRADLSDTVLFLGVLDIKPRWFEAPPLDKWREATFLLHQLGAFHEGKITPLGRRMLELPLSSRLARIILEGEKLTSKAARELISFISSELENDSSSLLKKRIEQNIRPQGKEEDWQKAMLSGFLDQVGKFRRDQKDLIHYSGKTIKVHHSLSLDQEFYLILDITQKGEAIKVLPIEEEWIWEVEPLPFTEDADFDFKDKITVSRKLKLGSIVFDETPFKGDYNSLGNLKEKFNALALAPFKSRLELFKKTPEFERMHFFAKLQEKDLEEEIDAVSFSSFFQDYPALNWDDLPFFLEDSLKKSLKIDDLNEMLPQKMTLQGKREIPIHYPLHLEPYVEAPIQDFYGTKETPLVANRPLTLKLLGPHKRPIQITKDIKSFWEKTYPELKKTYQREYPRHYWPDEPQKAKPFLLKSHLPKA